MRRPEKVKDIMRLVAAAARAGLLLYSGHANERLRDRRIVKPEVEAILVNGYHEARKDQFSEQHAAWDYAIRGKTVDGRSLRIVVALIEPGVIIVTAIDLDRER